MLDGACFNVVDFAAGFLADFPADSPADFSVDFLADFSADFVADFCGFCWESPADFLEKSSQTL